MVEHDPRTVRRHARSGARRHLRGGSGILRMTNTVRLCWNQPMHRQIAGKLTGPVTKWIILAAVVVIAGLMSPLNAKLVDVQNNEASSWLPGSAESTKVVEELTGTVDPNDIPTLVVYHRSSGLTDADLSAMDEDAQQIAEIKGVTDKGATSPNAAAALAAQGQPGVPKFIS